MANDMQATAFGVATLSLKGLVERLTQEYLACGGGRPPQFYVLNPGSSGSVYKQVSGINFQPGAFVICMTSSTFIHAAFGIPISCSVIALDSPLNLSSFEHMTPVDYLPDNPWLLNRSLGENFVWSTILLDLANRLVHPEAFYPHSRHVISLRDRVGLPEAIDLMGLESGSLLSALADLTTTSSKTLRTRARRALAQYLTSSITLDKMRRLLEEAPDTVLAEFPLGSREQVAVLERPEALAPPAIRHMVQVLTKNGAAYRAAVQSALSDKNGKVRKNAQFSQFEIRFLVKMIADELGKG